MVLAAAAYGAAELAGGLASGLLASGRAEALVFLELRPGLLLALAVGASGWPRAARLPLFACGLLLAALSQSLLLLGLGNPAPWAEIGRGLALGAILAVGADLLVQAFRKWLGPRGRWAGAAAGILLLALAAAFDLPQRLAPGAAEGPPSPARPEVLIMSGLPLAWGETGPFDPRSRPALAHAELGRYFSLRPVDVLDEASLARARLLFLAQPPRLAPAELAALDAWMRRGGRALILTDPALAWPSELPLGDIRRPPPVGLLAPLLGHWGLTLDPPSAPGPVLRRWRGRRLALEAPGAFRGDGGCAVGGGGWIALCRPGLGRAILVADADLMRDDLWAPRGTGRARRAADNPFAVADWLDWLADRRRPAPGGEVVWADPAANRAAAIALALIPIASCAGFGLLRRRRRNR